MRKWLTGCPATIVVAVLLIAVFVYEAAVGAAGSETRLLALGALRTRGWSSADVWRIGPSGLLHLNIAHLLANLGALLFLGPLVERRIGTARWIVVYVAAHVGSGVLGMLLGPLTPTSGAAVGSSGANSGLLAAAMLLVFYRSAREDDRRLRRPLAIFFAIAVVLSALPGVSYAGHLGGFLGGGIALLALGV